MISVGGRNLTSSKNLSLHPRFSPKVSTHETGEEETARGEQDDQTTNPRFPCFNWNLLLLLLLLRNRIVIYPCGGGAVSNRAVIYLSPTEGI